MFYVYLPEVDIKQNYTSQTCWPTVVKLTVIVTYLWTHGLAIPTKLQLCLFQLPQTIWSVDQRANRGEQEKGLVRKRTMGNVLHVLGLEGHERGKSEGKSEEAREMVRVPGLA